MSGGTSLAPLDVMRIMKMIPHRYPMLLVDRLIDIVPGQSATGLKAVTINEPFFQGHFPGRPIMPGVLIIEALAQTAGVHFMVGQGGEDSDKLVYFMSIENAKFRKPVEPGCLLHLNVSLEKTRGPVSKYKGLALVDDVLMAEAEFTAMIADRPAT
jgi:3-hydroxyacyl-[acyl-carrier-protein] dehydratase